MVIYAGTKGYLDDVPLARVQEFQSAFLAYVDSAAVAMKTKLSQTKELSQDVEDQLKQALNDFKAKAWKK